MKLNNSLASALLDKNKDISSKAVRQILESNDLEAWSCFVENSDRIFPFIKQNIAQNFANCVDVNNYLNLAKLFKIYSFDFEDCFAKILSDLSDKNSEIKEKMLELLKNGSDDEKAYAAKYFSLVNDERAAHYLFEAYSINFEPLKYNCAKALGDMADAYSYNYYVGKLKSEDDWEKTDAVQFLQSYGDKKAFPLLLNAMTNSGMPEHIAGHIALLENISEFFNSEDKNMEELTLECLQNIISSEAEIWPLSTIIDFKVYECLEKLIDLVKTTDDKKIKGRYAAILFYAYTQFSMFLENNEYKFNEDKETLDELDEIVALLKSQDADFWNECKNALISELETENPKRISFAVDVITEQNMEEFVNKLKEFFDKQTDETILYKLALSLYKFGKKEYINKDTLLQKISDVNLKAHIDALLNED